MATYMIFIREGEVFDPAQMEQYSAAVGGTMGDHPLKPLVVYGQLETLEGDAADGVVLLEFPDTEAARAWYYSPEYQAAAEHRKLAANYRVLMVEGLG